MNKIIVKSVVLIMCFAVLLTMFSVSISMALGEDDGFGYIIVNDEAVITVYDGGSSEVIIPSQIDGYMVTAIGNDDDAPFSGNSALVSVVIPDGIRSIASATFLNCKNLEVLYIGSGLESVGRNAFKGCSKISSVYYKGSSDQWNAINWGSGNNPLQYVEDISCNYNDNDTDEEHSHILTKTQAKSADCIQNGNKEYWSCTDCGKIYLDENAKVESSEEDVLIGALGHDWAEADCTTPQKCKREGCNETGGAATGHSWSDATCLVPETCLKCEITRGGTVEHSWSEAYTDAGDGTHSRVCTTEGCDARDEESAKSHNWNNATCKAPETCSVCGLTQGETAEHKWEKTKDHIEATCESKGYDSFMCTVCQEKKTGTSSPIGHQFPNEWIVRDANCKDDGLKYRVCLREDCYGTESVVILAKNHEGSEVYIETENEIKGTCKAEAKWDIVTYCKDCNNEIGRVHMIGEVDASNHIGAVYTEEENAVKGTCTTSKKWDLVTYCANCNEKISTEEKTGTTNPSNHTGGTRKVDENIVPGTCKTAKTWNEVTYCNGCDNKISSEAKTGDKDLTNHTGGVYTEEENAVKGTCTTSKKWDLVTYCANCNEKISTEEKTGTTNPSNHTGGTRKVDENIVPGTCKTAKTWNEVTYCNGCDNKISSEAKTGDKDLTNHTGGVYTEEENAVKGTCKTAKSWNEVTYCNGCNDKISTVAKTGNKDLANHTGGTRTADENVVPGTCKTAKTWNEVTYCNGCNGKISTKAKTGAVNPTNHQGTTYNIKENYTEGNCVSAETWNNVTYCNDCKVAVKSTVVTGNKNADNHQWSGVQNDAVTKTHYSVCLRSGCGRRKNIDHNLGGYVTQKNPTCTDKGVKYAYCSYCADNIYSDIPATGHKDSNGDGICDSCLTVLSGSSGGGTPAVKCSCNCHSSGISKLLFNIILFFQKIFGLNRVCSGGCGGLHY